MQWPTCQFGIGTTPCSSLHYFIDCDSVTSRTNSIIKIGGSGVYSAARRTTHSFNTGHVFDVNETAHKTLRRHYSFASLPLPRRKKRLAKAVRVNELLVNII
jgi:hypothetical protein